jgi:uncharacterized phage protein (TIGR01671 family)
MREILFRGKARHHNNAVSNRMVNAGEWLYGDLATHEEGLIWVNSWPVIPETVGQFTGLRDKNGTRIFEGDILELEIGEYDKIRGSIKWDQRTCIFILDSMKNGLFYSLPRLADCPDKGEVVGNIHDKEENKQ